MTAARRGPPPSAPQHDAEIVRLRETLGLPFSAIAQRLGIANGPRVASRYQRIIAQRDDRPAHQTKTRDCRCCRRPFPSQHAGVRMCDPCRARGDNASPFEPDFAEGYSTARPIPTFAAGA